MNQRKSRNLKTAGAKPGCAPSALLGHRFADGLNARIKGVLWRAFCEYGRYKDITEIPVAEIAAMSEDQWLRVRQCGRVSMVTVMAVPKQWARENRFCPCCGRRWPNGPDEPPGDSNQKPKETQ
jgi:hypothetical protein